MLYQFALIDFQQIAAIRNDGNTKAMGVENPV